MQYAQKPLAKKSHLYSSPRVLCILVCTFIAFIALAGFAPRVSAQSLGNPGGSISDPSVRQIDIARPAVVRILTTVTGRLTVHFTSTVTETFPLSGTSYSLELSGSGAFISAHGDILTADHVVDPERGAALDNQLYAEAAQDVADYINTHFQVTTRYTPNDAYSLLASGSIPSSTSYGQVSSKVYLSTSYAGTISGNKLEDVASPDSAQVDKIEAQSAFSLNDVAVIHVSGMDNMPSIQLGDSGQVTEQDILTIIGYPGLGDLSDTPTNLLTSSINKVYVSALKTTDSGAPVIQVGGNVEHGDSGGPALDARGNIVGVVSFGYSGVDGDYGETSFLQSSNGALKLIKSLKLNTTPGALQGAWTQAINDYAATSAGHWQKAAQEFQSLTRAYPGFQGLAPYLNYAQTQASQESSHAGNAGGGASLWVILIIILLLILLVAIGFVVLRRSQHSTLLVAPGGAQFYAANSFGAYPATQSYAQAGYGAPSLPAQPGAVPYAQPSLPASFPAPAIPYTSPLTYGMPVPLPQTPWPVLPATPLPTPIPLEQPGEAQAPAQLPSGTAWPVIVPAPEPPTNGESASASEGTGDSAEEQSAPAGEETLSLVIAPCGHPNTPDVRFCRVCGKPITEEAHAEASSH